MLRGNSPAHTQYSHFRCEEAVVTNVNHKKWTVDVSTQHSGKEVPNIQWMTPYTHFTGGEGVHYVPEVGAICMLAWPSDNTPPFVMGFKGAASPLESTDTSGAPESSSDEDGGSQTDVTYRARRPLLNPGDIAFTTRDENFIVLRRGGVVQIGATAISQRLYIPVLNYIKDFSENYEMHTFAGDVSWSVERVEHDPSGDAPCAYVFHMNEHAQDKKASVRVRHFPLQGPGGGDKSAWEVVVAAKNIDRDTGDYSDETYTLLVTMAGDKTELIGGSRSITVKGDDELDVEGSRSTTVGSNDELSVSGTMKHVARGAATFGGARVNLGADTAGLAAVLGPELVKWLSASVWPVTVLPGGSMVAKPSAAAIGTLRNILSKKVFLDK